MTSRPTTSQTSHHGASPATPKHRYSAVEKKFVRDRIEVSSQAGFLARAAGKITVSGVRKPGEAGSARSLRAVARHERRERSRA